MAINSYDIGDQVRLTGTFRDTASALVDPTTITFRLRDATTSTGTVYIHGTNAELVKSTAAGSSVGTYYVDYTATGPGIMYYRFEGTGAVISAGETVLNIRASRFR